MGKHKPKRTISCHGKRRFRDHGEAIRALHLVRATSERGRVPQRAYFCQRCNGYHLTSQA